ncbi:MAG: tetratricopeptide repeat protein, partial [Myxococcales bacterium]|nr:tetratricopeptide repeat protein [Myxococcales bacterium]
APEAQTLEPPAPEPPPRRAPRPRVRPSAPPPALIVPATPSADALLDEASRLRGQGRWAEAEVAYQRLIDAHPAHRAAYVARISAASLDLDHLARSARARDRYQAALTQGGPLDAEARWGLARAHRALGDAGAEVEALQALLQHHPKSAHAARARQRLEALAP